LLNVWRDHLDLTGTKKGCNDINAAGAQCWSTDGESIPTSRQPW
jgi:aerobic-type carbon monoxide dehydrogenase small subunit (CoxS/CutS family)